MFTVVLVRLVGSTTRKAFPRFHGQSTKIHGDTVHIMIVKGLSGNNQA